MFETNEEPDFSIGCILVCKKKDFIDYVSQPEKQVK